MPFRSNQVESATSLKQEIAKLLGGSSEDCFVFAQSGKDVTNKLFLGTYLDLVRDTGRTHFLTDGRAVTGLAAHNLEKLGCRISSLQKNDPGVIAPETLESEIRARTSLVSVAWADPLTGVIQPIALLAKVCAEKGVLLHVDASAALGATLCSQRSDFLSFEGGALGGPQGAAGVLVRSDSLVQIDEDEVNPELLGSLASSLRSVIAHRDHLLTETARLKRKFEEGLLAHLPDVSVLFGESERVPHICAIAFGGVHKEMLHFLLGRKGIHASAAYPDHEVLSFTLTHETTEEEIDAALEEIVAAVKKLRVMSPL